MRELFEQIQECNPNYRNVVLSIVEEGHPSEKGLISNRELIWESVKEGFFAKHMEEIRDIDESGIRTIGGVHVFCELLGQEKRLVICGAGHVSIPIIRMGRMIGCHVTVLEDRPKFADDARRAGADEVYCEPFAQGLDRIQGDGDTFFIVVTRGHRYDQVCIEKIADKPHAYIGMIGSRRRTALLKNALEEQGISRELLDSIYTPIGLDIGAVTPEEIAIAIMAEVISVKSKMKQNFGYSREMLKAILNPERGSENMILLTIIWRRGSTPRGVGSRMLVLADGNTVGTIGGGCAESNAIQKALYMLRTGDRETHIHRVDMSGSVVEDEGMVCGGVIDVLMECI